MDSPEEIDTVPNSPVNVAEDYEDDFARLVPSNDAARVAFHAVAELIQMDSSRLTHARRFIYVDPKRVALSPDSNTDTDTGTGDQTLTPLLYPGYYRFNLDILPRFMRLGWIMGRGKDYQNEQETVDLQLCLAGGNGVRSRHARIMFDLKTNLLFLIADKERKVLVNGRHELKGSQRVLGDLLTSIDIGSLRYNFEYKVQGREAYQRRLNSVKQQLGIPMTVAPLSVTPTPSSHDYEFHDYFLKPAFEAGSTCTVLAGVHKTTGALVAVKRMNRNRRNTAFISHEIDILHAIQESGLHPNICRLVDDIVTGDRNRGPVDRLRIDEAYLIYTPLALNTYEHLISSGVSLDDRSKFFKQILRGLAYLHSLGVMHRDIKPSNLMVVSYQPPRGMITDFGHATFEETSKDHFKGTLCYLAPEVWDLKHGRDAAPTYDKRADIWSYGVSAYQLFCFRTRGWGNEITLEVSNKMEVDLRRLDEKLPEIARLLRRMVMRDPNARISANDALETDIMQYIRVFEDNQPDADKDGTTKRKRGSP